MFSFLKKKPKTTEPYSQPNAEFTIFPRLRNRDYLEKLTLMGISREEQPVAEDLVGDLQLLFGVDEGDTFQLITPPKLRELGQSLDSVRTLVTQNCAAVLDEMSVQTRGPIHRLIAPNAMAGCSILFPSFWDHLETDLDGPAVLAVTSQDEILYTRDQPAEVAALKELLASDEYEEPLSGFLYQLDRKGWWGIYAQI